MKQEAGQGIENIFIEGIFVPAIKICFRTIKKE